MIIEGVRCRVQGAVFRVQGVGLRAEGVWRVYGGCRVNNEEEGLATGGCRVNVEGGGFRVQGSGCGVDRELEGLASVVGGVTALPAARARGDHHELVVVHVVVVDACHARVLEGVHSFHERLEGRVAHWRNSQIWLL